MKRCWADVVLPVPEPVFSVKEADLQLAMLSSGRGFGDFPLLVKWGGRQFDSRKDQMQKGLKWSWETSSWFLSLSLMLESKVGCMTANGVSRARFARAVGIKGSFEGPLPLAELKLSLFMDILTYERPVNIHTYIHTYRSEWAGNKT